MPAAGSSPIGIGDRGFAEAPESGRRAGVVSRAPRQTGWSAPDWSAPDWSGRHRSTPAWSPRPAARSGPARREPRRRQARRGETRCGETRRGETRACVRPGRGQATGVVRPGAVRPGAVRPGGQAGRGQTGRQAGRGQGRVATRPRPVGSGGRLTPNCERPCDRAPRSSLGRSVTSAAWTNSRCCGAALVCWTRRKGGNCYWTCDGQGGDCAHGCRELASTSVRHGSLLKYVDYVC